MITADHKLFLKNCYVHNFHLNSGSKMKKITYSINETLKNSVVFSGRSNRKEFWIFMLFYFFSSTILALINQSLYFVFSLLITIPMLSLSIRRLHDQSRSGFFILWAVAPTLIGLIVTLVEIYKSLISIGLQEKAGLGTVEGPVGDAMLFTAVGVILSSVSYYILMSLKGSEGENKYGNCDKVPNIFQ